MRTEIIATIDELNQYLEGNVTEEAVAAALIELLIKLITNMEIIHDITILIVLGIILQFIEKCIIHSEK